MSFSTIWAASRGLGYRRLRALGALLTLLALLAVPGCTIESANDGEGTQVERDVPGYVCGDTLEGTVAASPGVTSSTGVARYDYVLDSVASTVALDMFDAQGASLGQVTLHFDYEIGQRVSFFTDARYARDDAEVARQSTQIQIVEGELASFTRHEAEGREAVLWATMVRRSGNDSARAFGLESLTLGVPAAAGDAGPRLEVGGGAYRVATVLSDGGPLDEASATQFMATNGAGEIAASDDFRRMVAVAEDPSWADEATTTLRRCAASQIEGAEGALVSPQGLATLSLGQVQQAQGCAEQSNPFADVLAVEGVLGAIGTGTTLTGALIAAGVVSGGWAILGTLVVASVASYVILGKLESVVQDQAKKAPGIRDLVELGNDSGSGSSGGGGGTIRGAGSRGDPHLLTFDGLDYDFQGAGEFVLFEPVAGPTPTVQVRQEPSSGICSNVALNTAVATQLGGVRVHLDSDPGRELLLDGEPGSLPGATLLLPTGDSIRRQDSTVTLQWATGERLAVRGVGTGRSLDVDASLPDVAKGQVRGLLGTYDGNRANDLTSRDGAVTSAPVIWDEVVAFGETYRIGADESLFTYGPGKSTDSFNIAGFPSGPVSLADLPDDVRSAAEQTCLDAGLENDVALSNCILDVGCTGDPSFAESHLGVQAEQSLALSVPIDFSGWIVEGDGNWEVQPDGRSVLQTSNGPPTFFLSPVTYLNVEISGTLRVEGGDDDYIGFVIGYESPLTQAGDAPEDLVTQLVSWKGREQDFYGGTAFEGFTLSRATGVVDPLEDSLWYHPELPTYTVLASEYGDGLGWDADVTYTFSLVYTASLIEVVIDGEPLFSVSSAEAGGPFAAGRFGFYNFSQPGVRYADFVVSPVSE